MADIKVSKLIKVDDGKYLVQIKPAKTPEGALTGAQPHYFESRKEAKNFRKAAIMLDKTPEKDEIKIGKRRYNNRRNSGRFFGIALPVASAMLMGSRCERFMPKNSLWAIPIIAGSALIGLFGGRAMFPKGQSVEQKEV